MTLSEKLKMRRSELNWTQKDLAEVAGLNRWSIAQYEAGNAKPRKETLQVLADALEVDYKVLADDNADLHTEEELIDIYAETVNSRYGEKAAKGFIKTIRQNGYFFAGGILPSDDKDKYIAAVADTYLKYCELSIKKYGRILDDEDMNTGGKN